MQHESIAPSIDAPLGLTVPRALDQLDRPGPGRRFSPEAMSHKLNVLFMVSHATSSPAISVHATLMRFLDPGRVQVHVVYNRLATEDPYRSAGTSVLAALPRTPEINLRPAEFGPVGGAPRGQLLAATARSVVPALRDGIGLARYIERHGIDVIHCEEGTRNAFYALWLARMTRCRCVVHFHSQYGSWMSRPSRFAVHRADAIITVSSWTGRGIRQSGVPAERIFPVLNGIDVARWDPATDDGGSVRSEFGIAPGDPLVVMVAQLVRWKRQETAIAAFRLVADRHPGARLVLVGREWSESNAAGVPSYADELRRLIADLGLERNVILAGQRRDIRQILSAADIFALPSVGDPCALAHIEAMAMAKPVVAVADGGAPELVQDGVTGLVGPPDDRDHLARSLLALIDDAGRRREMGERGRQRVLEHLNAKRMADEVEGVYRLACGLSTVPGPGPEA